MSFLPEDMKIDLSTPGTLWAGGGRKKSARKLRGGVVAAPVWAGGSRKKSAWNMLVQKVYKAEKSINPNFQFKDALKKASSLKKS